MRNDEEGQGPDRRKLIHTMVALVWAAVMLVATFAVDKPGSVVPFWLLLVAYYITVWMRPQHNQN